MKCGSIKNKITGAQVFIWFLFTIRCVWFIAPGYKNLWHCDNYDIMLNTVLLWYTANWTLVGRSKILSQWSSDRDHSLYLLISPFLQLIIPLYRVHSMERKHLHFQGNPIISVTVSMHFYLNASHAHLGRGNMIWSKRPSTLSLLIFSLYASTPPRDSRVWW